MTVKFFPMWNGLLLVFLVVGLSKPAVAVDDCAACEAQGGVWLTDGPGSFCMKKLEPIQGPVLEPIPEEDLDFELEPGNFNGALGMGAYPDALAPVIGGHEMDIHDEFVISAPGQHTVLDSRGQDLYSFQLGDGQLAFGALADWNGNDDLLLLTLLDASPGPNPDTLRLQPLDEDGDGFAGNAVTLPGLGDFTFRVAFPAVVVPEPSAFALAALAFAWLVGVRRRTR